MIVMSYSDYLEYWMKEYFEINYYYKYSIAKRYLEAFETIKKELGKYRLCSITPYIYIKPSIIKAISKIRN